jgi:cellulose biosynthesis protein BcsQ
LRIFSFFNTKGGVGKSTMLILLADVFSSIKINSKQSKVLIIDVDTQSSSSIAFGGFDEVNTLKNSNLTFANMLMKIKDKKRFIFEDYIITKEISDTQTKSKKMKLGQVDVMTMGEDQLIEFVESIQNDELIEISKKLKLKLRDKYDFVFFDLPSNINRTDKLSVLVLMSSQYIIIPTESTKISINALTNTFRLISYVKDFMKNSKAKPKVLGLVMNKTDKREKQYKLHHEELVNIANQNETIVLKNFLPSVSELGSASDETLEYNFIKDKYKSYYDNIRKLALEIATNSGFSSKKS